MSKIEQIRADLMAERDKKLTRRREYAEIAELARKLRLFDISDKLEKIVGDEDRHNNTLDTIISGLKGDVGK